MDVSIYQAAAAMNATARWQEVISANLASSQIPGFKKQDLSFSSVQAGHHQHSQLHSPLNRQHFTMPLAGTSNNFKPGELHPTGTATDLALDGPGFFEGKCPTAGRATRAMAPFASTGRAN